MKKKQKSGLKNLKQILKNKTVLITGGAGSIGSILTKKILSYQVHSVRVLDIDEHALFKLKRQLNDSRLRLLLGDIQNQDRVETACNGVDVIIHLAAIKNIEISEFNPIETINTNISGTINLIKTALKNEPKIFLNVSTDKAVEPLTLYGTTKQLSERLTTWAGSVSNSTKFGTVRFGNVYETRGNVFETWQRELENNKPLSITHPEMKRYFFHIDEAIEMIMTCLTLAHKGEIFVPKMNFLKVKQLASKLSKKQRIVGKRKGEKLEEALFSNHEKKIAEERSNLWIIKPQN